MSKEKNKYKPRIVCVDFDGVIHGYENGWTGPYKIDGSVVPGALEFLYRATQYYDVCIFSSRTRYPFAHFYMKEWLREKFFWYFVNSREYRTPQTSIAYREADRVVGDLRFPLLKPPAHVFIDDRALQFTGTFPRVEQLQHFYPWKTTIKENKENE